MTSSPRSAPKRSFLTRSLKRDRKPTLPSRFLLRLQAVAGLAMEQAKARGDRYLELARALDRPETLAFIAAPEPRPPSALRPIRLSVTAVETLRRDPYAIFAGHILRLTPLDPIGTAPGPREIGMAWHAVLQKHGEGGAGRRRRSAGAVARGLRSLFARTRLRRAQMAGVAARGGVLS